jgi:hypothetical protein
MQATYSLDKGLRRRRLYRYYRVATQLFTVEKKNLTTHGYELFLSCFSSFLKLSKEGSIARLFFLKPTFNRWLPAV